MEREVELLIKQATPLVFGIFSHMDDQAGRRVVRVGGSGVFVAPFQALTARHVCRDLWRIDPERFDDLDKRTRGYFEPPHSSGLFQVSEGSHGSVRSAFWAVNRTWDPVFTDICFMEVSADSGAALEMQFGMPTRFFEWSLLPPPVGSHVVVLGFPKTEIEIWGELWKINVKYVMQEGTVADVFEQKRDSGMYSFPCFSIDKPVDPGFSGGPAFCDARLCGVVSGGSLADADVTYVATLWPLCLMEYEYPDQGGLGRKRALSELFERGVLRSDDWPNLRGRILKAYGDDGKPYARIAP